MAKRVFFSFHYQDVIDFRANVVRNHWMTKPNRDEAGFFDASIWESAKRQGDASLKALINGALDNTSVTCVLVGSDTHARPWVRYELMKSFLRGNKLLAVHVNSIKGKDSLTKPAGVNPLTKLGVTYSADGTKQTLWEMVGSEWKEYTAIGGTATRDTNVEAAYRGKGFHLGQWFSTYDWVVNDGYNKFADWVG